MKKTNELPPLTAPAAGGAIPSTGIKEPTPVKDVNKESNTNTKDPGGGKENNIKENGNKTNDKESKEPTYLFRPVAESPDASPQRMRTRNKAAKEQTSNRARPKRGEAGTPEPKTPVKHNNPSNNSPNEKTSNTSNTPVKNKKGNKNEKSETPSKNRKRGQEKTEEPENEEKELGLFKKKRERAEVCLCL